MLISLGQDPCGNFTNKQVLLRLNTKEALCIFVVSLTWYPAGEMMEYKKQKN